MKISLVMATHNHSAVLAKTLHSISRQTRVPDQIVIVEDGNSDQGETKTLCSKWQTVLPLEYYRREHRPSLLYSNQAVPLNAAFKKATGEVLLIHDDACLFTSPNDIENLVCLVEEDPNVTTYAVLMNLDRNGQNPGIEWVDKEGKPTFFNYRGQAIRKDIVMAMGGIEESFIGYGGDDCNFRERLMLWNDRSIKTHRLFNVVVHHQWHPSGRHDSELPIYHKNSAQYDRLSDYGKYGLVANIGKEWGKLD